MRMSTTLTGKLLLAVVVVTLSAPQDAEGQNAERLRLSCGDGNATACSDLGLLYANGDGVPRDLTRAASLCQQACDGGEALGCLNLGVSYHNGEGVTRDLERAAILLQLACDGGVAEACR
jgi:TPR repeat protein